MDNNSNKNQLIIQTSNIDQKQIIVLKKYSFLKIW